MCFFHSPQHNHKSSQPGITVQSLMLFAVSEIIDSLCSFSFKSGCDYLNELKCVGGFISKQNNIAVWSRRFSPSSP